MGPGTSQITVHPRAHLLRYHTSTYYRTMVTHMGHWGAGTVSTHGPVITTHARRPAGGADTHAQPRHARPPGLSRPSSRATQPAPPLPCTGSPPRAPLSPSLPLLYPLSLHTHPAEAAGWGEGRVLRAARGPLGGAAMAAAVTVVAAPTTVAATVVRGGICARAGGYRVSFRCDRARRLHAGERALGGL